MIACKQILGMLSFYATKVARTRISEGNSSAAAFGLLNVWLRGDLEPRAQGLLAINGSSVGSVGKRSTGPFSACTFRCTFPPHPIFRKCLPFFCARDFVLSDYAIMEIIDIILLAWKKKRDGRIEVVEEIDFDSIAFRRMAESDHYGVYAKIERVDQDEE